MSKRKRIFFIILGGVIVCGGLWYYLTLQQTIVQSPDETSSTTVSEETASKIPTLQTKEVLGGLSHVWDLGFLPDRTIIFTERAGTISKVQNGKKVVVHTVKNLQVQGEGGLMGLAIDPNFDKNRYIYACYNTANDIRVSRWELNTEKTALENQTDIITGIPSNTSTFPGRHSGCRPRFGNEGSLWVGTGDAAIGTNPQDPQSLGGKVLRVNRDGQPILDSLTLDDSFDPRIFSYGHRNVQGLVMEVKGGELCDPGYFGFSVEHGPDVDDEVNHIRPGNAGWDPVPGYNENVPMTDKDKFPDARAALWDSGKPPIAPSGAIMLRGSKWGRLDTALAIAALRGQHVRVLILDDDCGRSVTEEVELLKNFGRIRGLVMGPDENLYLTTDNGNGQDQIIEVAPQS